MKKYLFLLAATCMALVTFSSCSNDGDDTDMNITKEFFYGDWRSDHLKIFNATTDELLTDWTEDTYWLTSRNDGMVNDGDEHWTPWVFDGATYTITISSDVYALVVVDAKNITLTRTDVGANKKYMFYYTKIEMQ